MNQIKQGGGQIYAIIAIFLLVISTILAFIPILFIGLIKLIPYKPLQNLCARAIDQVVMLWCAFNNIYADKVNRLNWHIEGIEHLKRDHWYLVIANHQSWLDIVILQRLFHRKIPVLKFFIKDQLKWVPLLGFAWWAMGCPFMKRYSSSYLAKNPHKKGRDLAKTQKAMKQFNRLPSSIMNFVEGTRFTPQKHEHQQSPYEHLLMPKAGGIGYVISSMGKKIDSLLDVSIVYPKKSATLWDFLCRRIRSIKINIRHIPIPKEFLTQELSDNKELQGLFRAWLNEQWAIKDAIINRLRNGDNVCMMN